MKRKRILSALLAIIAMFSICAPALASGRENVPQYKNVLVFGDSITCAYGLPTSKSFGVAENSYADLVTKEVGASAYTSFAFTGCCIAQVMYMVGLDIEVGDIDRIKEFLDDMPGATSWARYEQVRSSGDIENEIKNSDLIMLAIGANDVGTVPFWRAYSVYNSALENGAEQSVAIKAFLDKYIEMLNMGLDYFMAGYPQILSRIREINPDADIVLVGSYNPFMKLKLNDSDIAAIGAALSPAVKMQNDMIKLMASQYDCIYADVFDLSNRFDEQNMERALRNEPLDTHPDYDGHAWMAEQILDAIAAEYEKPESAVCEFVSGLNVRLNSFLTGAFSAPLIEILDTVFANIGSFFDNLFDTIFSFPLFQ